MLFFIPKRAVSLLILLLCIGFLSFRPGEPKLDLQLQQDFIRHCDSLGTWVRTFNRGTRVAPADSLRFWFIEGRRMYKKLEPLAEYCFPVSANRLNGAPLPEAEPDHPLEPVAPQGYQVLEAMLYESDSLSEETRQLLEMESHSMIATVARLRAGATRISLPPEALLDALRLNLVRLASKGLSGFDCPESDLTVPEAAVTLQTTARLLNLLPQTEKAREYCKKGREYLDRSGARFETLDRAVFLRQYFNPLYSALYTYQKRIGLPFMTRSVALNPTSATLFGPEAFRKNAFAPSGTALATPEQVALGKQLFADRRLSRSLRRSCADCHQPNKGFADGQAVNFSFLEEAPILRNTPTLLNVALQPMQFYDGRVATLEDQIHAVITNDAEMGGAPEALAAELSGLPEYKTAIAKAYPGTQLQGKHIRQALAAYMRSLTRLNSAFDKYMQGRDAAMTKAQIRGFNLFMGKGKCGSCHFLPLFSGAVPPFYHKMESEVLGVPENADTVAATLDTDEGRFLVYGIPHHKYAFKTVTVRNADQTAPYMHNGVFSTLAEVIDFYDRAGGTGLGIAPENQTLSPEPLNLSQQEKADLIAFIEALRDF